MDVRFGVIGLTGFETYPGTDYIAFSDIKVIPLRDLSVGVYFHEMALGVGHYETTRHNPQDTIFNPLVILESPTLRDQSAMLLAGLRGPGHGTTTINGRVLPDYSQLNR